LWPVSLPLLENVVDKFHSGRLKYCEFSQSGRRQFQGRSSSGRQQNSCTPFAASSSCGAESHPSSDPPAQLTSAEIVK